MKNKIKELEIKLEGFKKEYDNFTEEGKELLANKTGGITEFVNSLESTYSKKLIELQKEKETLEKECYDFIENIDAKFCKREFNIDLEKGDMLELILSDKQYSIYRESKEGKICDELFKKMRHCIPLNVDYPEEIGDLIRRWISGPPPALY